MNLIGTAQAAQLLGVTDRHVRRLVESGKLAASYASTGVVLLEKRVVEQEVARRTEVSGEA
jgi:excisionase family DNA binding protein